MYSALYFELYFTKEADNHQCNNTFPPYYLRPGFMPHFRTYFYAAIHQCRKQLTFHQEFTKVVNGRVFLRELERCGIVAVGECGGRFPRHALDHHPW